MKIEDIPKNDQKWIIDLKHGSLSIQSEVHDAISDAEDTTELKSRIILYMADMMTDCAHVIKNANSIEDDRICTCKEKRGGKQ